MTCGDKINGDNGKNPSNYIVSGTSEKVGFESVILFHCYLFLYF